MLFEDCIVKAILKMVKDIDEFCGDGLRGNVGTSNFDGVLLHKQLRHVERTMGSLHNLTEQEMALFSFSIGIHRVLELEHTPHP